MLVGGLLAAAVALFVVFFFRVEKNAAAPAEGVRAASLTKRADSKAGADRPRATGADARAAKQKAAAQSEALRKSGGARPAPDAVEKEKAPPPADGAAAEKAVEAWEGLVDALAESKDVPTHERMMSVKEAFDAVAKKDQMDAIHTALNLVPDEQFAALYAILFDKQESEDVLDAIFSDALNRPEEIKVPLMKELAKDKTHPMYFESARILDATGELEDMAGGAEKERPASPSAGGQKADQ
jgi:hypothetical protein